MRDKLIKAWRWVLDSDFKRLARQLNALEDDNTRWIAWADSELAAMRQTRDS